MNKLKVTFDTKELEQFVQKVTEDLVSDDVQLEIHKLLAETVYPWTPYLSGNLSSDVTITPSGVTYNADYASNKYYGEVYCHDVHPLATSHWDDVAMQTEFDTFANGVKDILIRRATELYG